MSDFGFRISDFGGAANWERRRPACIFFTGSAGIASLFSSSEKAESPSLLRALAIRLFEQLPQRHLKPRQNFATGEDAVFIDLGH